MNYFKTIFTTILVISCYNALAWGARGHKIVAQIAQKCLDKAIIDSVQYYLEDLSFEDASVWMDQMRSDSQYDYMKPWHYVNIERDKTYVKTDNPNIINALEKAIEDLKLSGKDRIRNKINMALKIIFHLVGDLHQPLHTGYGEDKGGNGIEVDFLGKSTNLHKVWDSEIIESAGITTSKCLELANALPAKEKQEIQKINVTTWMEESRSLLPDVYNFSKSEIREDYVNKNVPIIEKQLVKAGIRLASILHQNFKK